MISLILIAPTSTRGLHTAHESTVEGVALISHERYTVSMSGENDRPSLNPRSPGLTQMNAVSDIASIMHKGSVAVVVSASSFLG
jgi:hypothetical protein